MTLHTRVAIRNTQQRTVTPGEAFDLLRELIGARDDYQYADRMESYPSGTTRRRIEGEPEQGYDAWVWVTYDPAGRMRDEGQYEDGERPDPDADLITSFDTTYGYEGSNGEGCAELHGRFIVAIIERFSGAEIEWYDEYTGEWFTGTEHLHDFGRAGEDGRTWFNDVVLPVVGKLLE